MDIAGVTAARNLIGFSFAAASSTTYTVSFYVESVSGVTGIVAYASGTLGTGGTTNSITAPTSTGRVSYTFTTGTSAGTVDLRFGIGAAANESGSIRLSNVQCEAGAFATSYIPTVASQVTRTADTCTITAPLFAPWYNQTQGTFVANSTPMVITGDRGVLSANDGTGNNNVDIRASSAPSAVAGVGGVTQAVITLAGAAVGVSSRLAFAYQVNNFAATRDGGAVSADTSGTVPTVTQMQIGNLIGSTAFALNGHIRSIQFYPVRLADFQLQALTA
jgi:hypothetical protein